MGKGSYLGGSTLIHAGSDWFGYSEPKQHASKGSVTLTRALEDADAKAKKQRAREAFFAKIQTEPTRKAGKRKSRRKKLLE